MEQRLLNTANEIPISFNLELDLGSENIAFDEIDGVDGTDETLQELLQNVSNAEQANSKTLQADENESVKDPDYAPPTKKKRFKKLSNEQVDQIGTNSIADRTHKQTSWAVKIFTAWLKEYELDTKFENYPKEQLAETLRKFYPEARKQNENENENDEDVQRYAKQSLINLRSGLNRYLQLPPNNKTWNLMRDAEFIPANKVFKGHLRMQKKQGFDRSRSHRPITQQHVTQVYKDYLNDHFEIDPVVLQHKVYFDLSFYLGGRGCEGLRELTKDSFKFKLNQEGREYFELSYNQSTKKSQGDDNKEINDNAIVLSQPGKRACPVKSFKLYLSKLSNIDALFQLPNRNYKNGSWWYKNMPCGINTIGSFMKEISKNAGLSYIYTNHCTRGTTATAMKWAGYSIQEIAFVLKHKNLESLKHYLEKPNMNDKESISGDLFKYSGVDVESEPDDSDFASPPVPVKFPKVRVTKKPASTVSVPPKNEVAISENTLNTNENSQPAVSNFMQMFKQNPVGMFMGAQLSNCTINVNLPK